MSDLPYFQLYVGDYDRKTAHLSAVEDGIYFRLLRLCWTSPGCKIPADEAWIMRKARARTEDEQEAVRTVIAEFFRRSKGKIWNDRLLLEFASANKVLQGKIKGGKNSAAAKALKNNKSEAKTAPTEHTAEQQHSTNYTSEGHISDYSEANASGAEAPPPDPIDPVKLLFDAGIRVMGACNVSTPKARQMVGKWRRDHPGQDGQILTAIMDCGRAGAVDPIPWIEARLRPRSSQPSASEIMARAFAGERPE